MKVPDSNKMLGPGELHPLVPGVGSVLESRILEVIDAYLKQPAVSLPDPILLVNCNGPNWARETGVDWVMPQLEAAYAAGVRMALLNINHPDLTFDRQEEMVEKIGAWLERHADMRLGPYMRPAGRGNEWAGPYLLADEKGRRPADEDVAWWAKLAGGYDRLVLSVDASSRHAHTADFAEKVAKLGTLFIGEAHGDDWDRPYATVGIERRDWRNYHRLGKDVPQANGRQYLWYSKHVVAETGKTVADSLGLTDAEVIEKYARQRFGIVGDLGSIEAWRDAVQRKQP